MGDVGGRGEFGAEEALVAVPVGGDDLQYEIGLAREHMRLAYLGPTAHQLLERRQIAFGLARQPDLGKDGDRKPERFRRQGRVVAADQPRFLERAHPAQTGRRGNPDAAGELDIGHSPVGLQILQDAAVDTVQLNPPHPGSLCALNHTKQLFDAQFYCAAATALALPRGFS